MMRNKMTSSVAEDQIENVGIMQGFMDDIDEMMKEIDTDMMPDPNDEDDVAMVLGRSPDSPEILMNNLRGDYRSIDARREELADLVGYNAAAETPDQVLALLQPLLAQQMAQGIGAIEPPAMPMGDMPMPDGGIGGLPAMPGMPPQDPMAMQDPMMAMQQDPMAMQQDPMAMQQDPMMAMQQPAPMATGGMVQRFQEGSTPAAVTRSGPSALDEFLARQGQASVDPMARTKELSPAYRELLGLGDAGADRSGMAFDIAQAALNFAGNVDPQGQPMRGSFASRLAGAASALPAQMGKRAEAARQDETRARLAALQQAQSEQASTLASNTALSSDQRAILLAREQQSADMALEMAKSAPSFRAATQEEAAQFNAIAGQIDDRTGRFYPANPPSGMTITSTPDGGLQLTQGPGVGSSRAGGLEYAVENGVTVARPIPGTPAAAEVQAQRGKLESALLTGQDMIGTLESIVGRPAVEGGATAIPPDPALESILGMVQGRFWPATQAGEDLKVKIDQIAGVAFLQAFESIKGAGAITKEEGEKATQAIAKLSRTQSPEAFKASLFEFTDIVRRGMEKARADLAALPRLDSPAPTVLRFDEQGNPLQ
jgi:hypothetical protein